MGKSSIRKIISHLAEGANYISEVIVAEDVTFLNIYNKSEDEVLRLLISKLPCMDRLTCQYIKKDGSKLPCMDRLTCQYIKKDGSKLPRIGHFICQYIKRDGSICGKGCWRPEGCSRHFNARPRTICPVCKQGTYSDTGICSTHGGIYDHALRESKKTKTESIPLGSSNMVKT